MFILYVGNFGPRHSTENHIKTTLEGMGHHVKMAQENMITSDDVIGMLAHYPVDVFLWTRTWNYPGDELPLAEARRRGIPSVAYHLDLYNHLRRRSSIWDDAWWRCDFVFTPDGGSPALWQEHGVNHYWMPPGVLEEEAYLADVAIAGPDVLFVGTGRDYHREWPYRTKLLNWLRATYRRRFVHVGTGGRPAVRNHALNLLYASSKVVVGDALCPGFTHERYWSDRVPETLGRGGFLIHPYIVGLDEFFEDQRDLVYYQYNDFAGLKGVIDYFLRHADEREAIRRHGHETCLSHSTYRHRMETMMEVVTRGMD